MYLTVEVVEQVLQHRGYQEKNRTQKKVAYQHGQALPLYLNLQSKKGTSVLVAHPQSGVEVMQGQGGTCQDSCRLIYAAMGIF